MTPEDLNNAVQSAALTYVREVKQRGTSLCGSIRNLLSISSAQDNISIGMRYPSSSKPVDTSRSDCPSMIVRRESPSCCGGMQCSLNHPSGGIMNQEPSEWAIYQLGLAGECVPSDEEIRACQSCRCSSVHNGCFRCSRQSGEGVTQRQIVANTLADSLSRRTSAGQSELMVGA